MRACLVSRHLSDLIFFWGGAVTTQDPAVAHFLRETVKSWPRLSARDYLRPALGCIKYDIATRPLLFRHLVFPAFMRRAQDAGSPPALEHARIETVQLDSTLTSLPSFSAFAEWNRKLHKIDSSLAHRRFVARIYRERLGDYMVSGRTASSLFEESCFVNFPVVAPETEREKIYREMTLSGFDVGRSLYPNVHRHPKFENVSGYSFCVDQLTRTSIYLPTHFGVSAAYADAIATHLRKLLRKAKACLLLLPGAEIARILVQMH